MRFPETFISLMMFLLMVYHLSMGWYFLAALSFIGAVAWAISAIQADKTNYER